MKAAEDAATAAKRSADAHEQQVELARPPAIDFVIQQLDKARYAMFNAGTESATGVTIAEDQFAIARDLPSGVTLEPRQSHPFTVFQSWGSPLPTSVLVTCNEMPNGVHVPVPPMR